VDKDMSKDNTQIST